MRFAHAISVEAATSHRTYPLNTDTYLPVDRLKFLLTSEFLIHQTFVLRLSLKSISSVYVELRRVWWVEDLGIPSTHLYQVSRYLIITDLELH